MKRVRVHDPNSPWLSGWFITINSNRTERGFIQALDTIWGEVTSNIADYITTRNTPSIDIISVFENHTIERGSKYHRIHLHARLEVDSRGICMLRYSAIRRYFNRRLSEMFDSFKAVKFDGSLIKGTNAIRNIDKYIGKNPLQVKVRNKDKVVSRPPRGYMLV